MTTTSKPLRDSFIKLVGDENAIRNVRVRPLDWVIAKADIEIRADKYMAADREMKQSELAMTRTDDGSREWLAILNRKGEIEGVSDGVIRVWVQLDVEDFQTIQIVSSKDVPELSGVMAETRSLRYHQFMKSMAPDVASVISQLNQAAEQEMVAKEERKEQQNSVSAHRALMRWVAAGSAPLSAMLFDVNDYQCSRLDLNALVEEGYVEPSEGVYRVTEAGRAFAAPRIRVANEGHQLRVAAGLPAEKTAIVYFDALGKTIFPSLESVGKYLVEGRAVVPVELSLEDRDFVLKGGHGAIEMVRKMAAVQTGAGKTFEEREALAASGSVVTATPVAESVLLRFNQEVSGLPLDTIAMRHGVQALVDLVRLQGAIAANTALDVHTADSRLLEVLQSLPSGQDWIGQYTNELGLDGSVVRAARPVPVPDGRNGRDRHVLARQTLQRYEVMQGQDDALPNEPTYELTVEPPADGGMWVYMAPVGAPAEVEGLPQLALSWG